MELAALTYDRAHGDGVLRRRARRAARRLGVGDRDPRARATRRAALRLHGPARGAVPGAAHDSLPAARSAAEHARPAVHGRGAPRGLDRGARRAGDRAGLGARPLLGRAPRLSPRGRPSRAAARRDRDRPARRGPRRGLGRPRPHDLRAPGARLARPTSRSASRSTQVWWRPSTSTSGSARSKTG
jgi:hypothetical protein